MHVLLAKAERFPLPQLSDTAGWMYLREFGAWVDADEPDSLMAAPKPPPQPPQPPPKPRPVPVSKKFDHETGEDMKGP
jgi:hypothetical protein